MARFVLFAVGEGLGATQKVSLFVVRPALLWE
ncbi:hypothetical protein MPNT_250004 [Candidatus Methylacidithermus pantelleriae]|uniref:Uncharacterized protein n=1 Tax=Candidatus Methylacidithermus pantelleriae TaxID=2744239 RepID=A0A8J2FQ64_9BACT|nr:hypothetical protein MPNT_250004 [Candidatus Methylacidithermus pantelleriae]